MALTKQQKLNFVRELLASMEESITAKLDRIPAEWDGIELRQYIAEIAADNADKCRNHLRGNTKRGRAYRNALAIQNL